MPPVPDEGDLLFLSRSKFGWGTGIDDEGAAEAICAVSEPAITQLNLRVTSTPFRSDVCSSSFPF